MEFLFELIFAFLWWGVLFPAVWVLSAPVVLVLALFDKTSYMHAVGSRFRTVTKFWADWGIVIVP